MKHILIFIVLSLTSLSAATKQEIIAATLIAEAGGEKAFGAMEAINEVILNRSKSRNIPTDKTVLQKDQFSCWNGKSIDSVVSKAKKHPKWKVALSIVNNPKTNFVKGSDHYHTKDCNPKWNRNMAVVKVIGAHIFYRG